jgi:isoleucyl-tRNA synthetase
MRQLRIFRKMVEKGMFVRDLCPLSVDGIMLIEHIGLICRHYRPVHFSPSSRSALAEAELVYKDDHVSHSVFVTFDLDKNNTKIEMLQTLFASAEHEPVKLLVWTTTPWTLTANMGIAVHPDLEYVVIRSAHSGLVIVSKERLEALGEILGETTEVVVKLRGSFGL